MKASKACVLLCWGLAGLSTADLGFAQPSVDFNDFFFPGPFNATWGGVGIHIRNGDAENPVYNVAVTAVYGSGGYQHNANDCITGFHDLGMWKTQSITVNQQGDGEGILGLACRFWGARYMVACEFIIVVSGARLNPTTWRACFRCTGAFHNSAFTIAPCDDGCSMTGGGLTLQGSIAIGDPNDAAVPPGPPGNEPSYVAISTFGGVPKAWVANHGHAGVDVLDLSVAPAVHYDWKPAPEGYSQALAVDVKDGVAAVSYYDHLNGSAVAVYNVATGATISSFAVAPHGSGSLLAGIAIVDNSLLVVTDRNRNTIESWNYAGPLAGLRGGPEVSTVSNSRISTNGPGFAPTDVKVVTTSANRFVAVVMSESDRVEIYSLRSDGRIGASPLRVLSVGLRPERLAIEPTRRMVFVTSSADDRVSVLGGGAPSGTVLEECINGPHDVSVSVDVGGNAHIYVANRNTRSLAHYAGPVGSVPVLVGSLLLSRAPFGIASQFGLPIGAPPNPPSIGDRIVVTTLADDALDDLGR